MKIYNALLQEIKNELNKENVESNENQISLYDLYNLVNTKYEDLRNISENKKHFKKSGLFGKIVSYSRFEYDSNSAGIYIELDGSLSDPAIFIRKENGSKDFFIQRFHICNEEANKFIKKNYDKIMQLLFILEKYSTEFYEFKSEINKFNIEYNNYKFNIYINNDGKVDLKIELIDNINNKEMYNRQYYQKDTLMEILEDSRFELSKKIKIDVNTLDNSIVDVINKSEKMMVKN